MEEEQKSQISQKQTTPEDKTLTFLDSLDDYLVLIETLSSTLRQGWMELASARYSMGASRINAVLLNHKQHSAATTVELDYHNAGSMTKSPHFSLRKWASSDDKDLSLEKENIEEDEKLKENLSDRDSENQEHSTENSYESEPNALTRESNGSETSESPRKTENPIQKERAKVLSVYGTLVSPKLRASQLSFETALETLVKIANARSSILETHNELQKDIKSSGTLPHSFAENIIDEPC